MILTVSTSEESRPGVVGRLGLGYHDSGCPKRLAGGLRAEVAHHAMDETADVPVQALVVAEEDSEDLGQGEDRLPVRQAEQLVHVLVQEQCALLGEGRAQVNDAAAEAPELLNPTPRVCAPDPGHSSAAVSAGQEAFHGLADAFEAELAEALGELGLAADDELGEVSPG